MKATEFARVRKDLERRGWLSAARVAGMMFLTLLACGAALLVAGKLQFSSLGSGANPFEILQAIGLVALACLGITIELGDLPVAVTPLGVLVFVILVSARAWREVDEEGAGWRSIL